MPMSKLARYKRYTTHAGVVFSVVFLATSVYLWLELKNQDEANASLENTLQNTLNWAHTERASTTLAIETKDSIIADLSDRLNLTEEELEDTEGKLKKEKRRNDKMEDQITDLADTVSDLDKLSKTDEELLQKYSKVYFLNEHYIPESIKEIDNEWKYSESRTHKLHSKVMPFFEDMVEEAKDDGINLWVVSAFRSFDEQAHLKGRYTVIYGSGANTFSADQGFSEHQLGTTVDFTTSGIGGALDPFGSTPAYQWLLDNAHKYGFVMSYPPNNAYYVFEPWHWRFVGTKLAKALKKDEAYFYDWDQRDIDKYLINIFD